MTASNPHRHIKKRLIKTVGAHTPCSCGYIQGGDLYFYIKDYQGNVRVALNQTNQPVEINSYYPYGGLMAATTTEGTQPYKYSSKELDRENGLDLYDSKARMYDPTIGRTPTQDPMAEKYYSISPYLWCAGNPIKYVDPYGKKIKLADNSSTVFKSDYAIAYNYLKQHDASFILDMLDERTSTFIIAEYDGDSYFDPQTNTIFWNSHRALMTNTAYILTPAELLSHESDHALEFDRDKEGATKRNNTPDEKYGNKDDTRVIEGPEQDVAKKLGRVQDVGSTRTDHFGTGYYVPSSDSDEVESICITPKKQNKQ